MNKIFSLIRIQWLNSNLYENVNRKHCILLIVLLVSISLFLIVNISGDEWVAMYDEVSRMGLETQFLELVLLGLYREGGCFGESS
ncbi:hypothetical protein D3C74_302170 [compost metagenome]